jgi:DNA-binding NarL/FixJ family response regulator
MTPIPVLIAAKDELYRTGVTAMLKGSRLARVIGEAADTKTTQSLTKKLKPKVLLLDIGIAGQETFKLVAELAESQPQTKCVLFTALENPIYMARAQAAGAADCLFADFTREELISAIKAAAAGRRLRSGRFTEIAETMSLGGPRKTSAGTLSPRQAQVLDHLTYGLSNEEIGRSTGITSETVKDYMRILFRKLGVADRVQAAVWAIKPELIEERPERASQPSAKKPASKKSA